MTLIASPRRTGKGLFTLLEAVKPLAALTLKLIGEGPAGDALRKKVESEGMRHVRFLGYLQGEQLKDEIRSSMAVVLPSECYENNPRSIIEGFALGKPAIGARTGGIPELVIEQETGWLFEPRDVENLRARLTDLVDHAEEAERMGRNARRLIEREFNQDTHYQRLIEIYHAVLQRRDPVFA